MNGITYMDMVLAVLISSLCKIKTLVVLYADNYTIYSDCETVWFRVFKILKINEKTERKFCAKNLKILTVK